MTELVLSADDLLERSCEALDDGALGQLVGIIADMKLDGSRTATLQLLAQTELFDKLCSPEFVEGLGRSRLKTKLVLRLLFRLYGGVPSGCNSKLAQLMSAGAVNIYSDSAVEQLHNLTRTWTLGDKSSLVATILQQTDSYNDAGIFLRYYLDADASQLTESDELALVDTISKLAELRDLGGELRSLTQHAPDRIREALAVAMAAAVADSEGSDADEDGNLRGFVHGDDEIHYDTDATPESSGREVDDVPTSRKRPRVDSEAEPAASRNFSGAKSTPSGPASDAVRFFELDADTGIRSSAKRLRKGKGH
jgi:hypothetical protein